MDNLQQIIFQFYGFIIILFSYSTFNLRVFFIKKTDVMLREKDALQGSKFDI